MFRRLLATRLPNSSTTRHAFNRRCQSFAEKTAEVADASRWAYYYVIIPKLGIVIGLSALTFQIGVLYPWHIELGDEFTALAAVTKRIEEKESILEKKLDHMMTSGGIVQGKEIAILDLDSLILEKLDVMESIVFDTDPAVAKTD